MFPLSEWDTEYRKISNEWKKITIMTIQNYQLYDNLIHSISWLLKYVKENNIKLPSKHELVKSIEESQLIMDRISDQSIGNINQNHLRGNSI